MKNLSDAMNSGTSSQVSRRRTGIMILCMTAILLIIATIILTIGGIIAAVTTPKETPDDSEGGAGAAGYTTTTLDAATQLKTGDLLLLDDDHPYGGEAPTTVLFSNHKSRPKNDAGKNIYTISGVDKLAGTEQTVEAFHAMLKDFYAESQDDNLILAQAYDVKSGNQPDALYGAATTVDLSYYVYYKSSTDNEVATIYEVEKYQWIYDNAYKYGFVRASSAEGEEAMFRYVGKAHATYMNKQGKTLDQYVELLQTKTYQSPLKVTVEEADGKISYSIYHLSAEETAYVPEHGKYTVSGDNLGGYIITVNNTAAKNNK